MVNVAEHTSPSNLIQNARSPLTLRKCLSQDQKTCRFAALAWLCSQVFSTNHRLRTHPLRNAYAAQTVPVISHTKSAPSPHVSADQKNPLSICVLDCHDSSPSLSTAHRISRSKHPWRSDRKPALHATKRIQMNSPGAPPLSSSIPQSCNRLRRCVHNRTSQPICGGRPRITESEYSIPVSRQHL